MRCSKAARQLQLYSDKQLRLAEVRALEAHLSTCSTCRRELSLLEGVVLALHTMEQVPEPVDLTNTIMQRVALTPQQNVRKLRVQKTRETPFVLLRPSLLELLTAIVLATFSTLGLILQQPALRTVLPIGNGHDGLSILFIDFIHSLTTISGSTMSWMLWVIGAALGVWITLVAAGNELRTAWLKAVMDRLPVW